MRLFVTSEVLALNPRTIYNGLQNEKNKIDYLLTLREKQAKGTITYEESKVLADHTEWLDSALKQYHYIATDPGVMGPDEEIPVIN